MYIVALWSHNQLLSVGGPLVQYFSTLCKNLNKLSGVGACCVMSAWWSKLKMLPFFTFSTGMPVLYVDTDQHLTQLLCSLYTGVGRSTSEV